MSIPNQQGALVVCNPKSLDKNNTGEQIAENLKLCSGQKECCVNIQVLQWRAQFQIGRPQL